MKSTIILVADDYGLSPGVNRAIIDLAGRGRLSAVSCMSLAPYWEEGAPALKALQGKVAVGLHLTLTYLPPLTRDMGAHLPGLRSVLINSWARALDLAEVEAELKAQFEKFIAVFGAPPEYLDGHQHIHVLPGVREIVLKLRGQYAPQSWIRNVVDFSPAALSVKQLVLNVLGWRFRETLRRKFIPHNDCFRGAYDYNIPTDFPLLMDLWSEGSGAVLIYCHPAFPDEALSRYDTLIEPRQKEYDFLNSETFAKMLEEKITLAKHPETAGLRLAHQLWRFIVTGGINTVVGYLIYAAGIIFFNLNEFRAVTASYVLGFTFSFFMFRTFVFTTGERGLKSYLRFLPTYIVLYLLNLGLLHWLVGIDGWNKLLAQAVIVPLCAALSFIINRVFVFKE